MHGEDRHVSAPLRVGDRASSVAGDGPGRRSVRGSILGHKSKSYFAPFFGDFSPNAAIRTPSPQPSPRRGEGDRWSWLPR